jgi:DNA polymerase III subunit epsilon
MKILGIDFETNGCAQDEWGFYPTEIGVALYDNWRLITAQSHLINIICKEKHELRPEIAELTGLKESYFERYAKPYDTHVRLFLNKFLLENGYFTPDFIFVWNGLEFDWLLIKRYIAKDQIEYWSKRIIDVKNDFGFRSSLSHTAADFGFLNPYPHNALADVFTMVEVAKKHLISVCDDVFQKPYLEEIGAQEYVKVRALVSFEEKQKAKEAGFRWDAEEKIWWKTGRVNDIRQICYNAGLAYEILYYPIFERAELDE